jgi:hypothetical protein
MRDRIAVGRIAGGVARRVAAVALVSSVALLRVGAQGRLSEKALVSQAVGSTTITVEYYRPVARGRADLIPGVVHWGQWWTPGANWATTIEVDRDVTVEGQMLPKGKYSLWTMPRPDSWTIDFHRSARRFHLSHPDSSDRQLSVRVRPDSGARTDVLTFDFPEVAVTGTTLRLRWGTTVVPLHLAMLAPPLTMVSKADHARFLGRYDLEMLPIDGGPSGGHLLVDIAESGDTLKWRDVENPRQALREFILSPSAGSGEEFTRAQRGSDGQWWTQTGFIVAFTMASGRASGFEVRVEDGAVIGSRAKRVR